MQIRPSEKSLRELRRAVSAIAQRLKLGDIAITALGDADDRFENRVFALTEQIGREALLQEDDYYLLTESHGHRVRLGAGSMDRWAEIRASGLLCERSGHIDDILQEGGYRILLDLGTFTGLRETEPVAA